VKNANIQYEVKRWDRAKYIKHQSQHYLRDSKNSLKYDRHLRRSGSGQKIQIIKKTVNKIILGHMCRHSFSV